VSFNDRNTMNELSSEIKNHGFVCITYIIHIQLLLHCTRAVQFNFIDILKMWECVCVVAGLIGLTWPN